MPKVLQCPVCHKPSSPYVRGTTSAKDFFCRPPGYALAAGREKEMLPVWRCLSCGHGFTPIDFPEKLLSSWYEHSPADSVFLADEKARRRTARRVLARIGKFLPSGGRLLDIGTGPGFFLAEAQSQHWQAAGIDVSHWSVSYAQQQLKIVDMRQGDITALADMPDAQFDCVVSFDVLEHVVYPRAFLGQAKRLLRPGGWLVLTTPRFDSLVARLTGRRWHCIFPAHLHYFTRRSLYLLLNEAGLHPALVVAHTRYLSLQYLLERSHNLFPFPFLAANARVGQLTIPVNIGDEFEVYAQG